MVGTTFRMHHKRGETSTVYTELEPNRRIEFEVHVGPLRPKGAFDVAGDAGGTELSVDWSPTRKARSPSPRRS